MALMEGRPPEAAEEEKEENFWYSEGKWLCWLAGEAASRMSRIGTTSVRVSLPEEEVLNRGSEDIVRCFLHKKTKI